MSTAERSLYAGLVIVPVILFSPGVDIGIIIAVLTIIGASGISLSLRELSRWKEDRVEDSYPTFLISLVAFSIITLHGPEAQIMPRLVPEMSGRPEIVGVVGLISLVAGLVAWCWNGDDSTESSRQGDPSPGQDHSAEDYMAGETDVDDESDDGDTDVNEGESEAATDGSK
ncbi:hypothetical protein [Haloarcula marismortui]|uniref:Uncharacterized protein n=1 Tax=Haloarcula marismortui (strain ATCC 43049 / DSM 3752 / JCM 8966 / VKM B-1809) TaxID=272569 RepID=A0A4P8K059_HALMA|nr:hypothetical protein [Haloarcula marismortui]QCP91846.1 hypothetical protein E6P14_13650 [Haloarcula marismortui ATCC 43049]